MIKISAYIKTIKDVNGNTIYPQTKADAIFMTGYEKPTTGGEIVPTDTIKQAIGKLDKDRATVGTTTGTATALELAQADFVLADGALVRLKLHVDSGATPTLNINNTGAKALMQTSTQGLSPIAAGTWLTFVYSETLGFFVLQGSGTEPVKTRFGNGANQISTYQLAYFGVDVNTYQPPRFS